MATSEVKFKIPKELAKEIKNISKYGYQSFILGLYLDEEISIGKAAQLLNMTYDEFIDLLGKYKIPYFRETPEEIHEI